MRSAAAIVCILLGVAAAQVPDRSPLDRRTYVIRVEDLKGTPVSDARIHAVDRYLLPDPVVSTEEIGTEEMFRLVARFGVRIDDGASDEVTVPAGSFRKIVAVRRGGQAECIELSSHDPKPGDSRIERRRKTAVLPSSKTRLHVRVVNAAGRPVSGVRMAFLRNNSPLSGCHTTDADGSVRLPIIWEGSFDLAPMFPGAGASRWSLRAPGRQLRPMEVTLSPRGVLDISIDGPSGHPFLEPVEVRVMEAISTPESSQGHFLQQRLRINQAGRARTREGRVRIPVEPGRMYHVRARVPRWSRFDAEVTVRGPSDVARPVHVRLRMPPERPTVRGSLVGRFGSPVPGLAVRLVRLDETGTVVARGWGSSMEPRAVTDATGRFRIVTPAVEGTEGRLALLVRCQVGEGFTWLRVREFPLTARFVGRVSVASRHILVAGRVVDVHGDPVATRVHLQRRESEGWRDLAGHVYPTKSDGSFEIRRDPPGQLRLRVEGARADAPQLVPFLRGHPDYQITMQEPKLVIDRRPYQLTVSVDERTSRRDVEVFAVDTHLLPDPDSDIQNLGAEAAFRLAKRYGHRVDIAKEHPAVIPPRNFRKIVAARIGHAYGAVQAGGFIPRTGLSLVDNRKLRIRMKVKRKMQVQVVDFGGRPVAGVPVVIGLSDVAIPQRRFTDAEGIAWLPSKPRRRMDVDLGFGWPGAGPARWSLRPPARRQPVPFEMRMAPRGALWVTIDGPDGRPFLDTVEVMVREVVPGESSVSDDFAERQAVKRRRTQSARVVTREGRVVVSVEPARMYHVRARAPSWRRADAELTLRGPIESGQSVACRLRLGPERPMVRGRLVGDDGTPARDVAVRVVVVDPAGKDLAPLELIDGVRVLRPRTVTDAHGRFAVVVHPLTRTAGARLALLVRCEAKFGAFAWQRVREFGLDERDLGDVGLGARSRLVAGRVVDAAGKPVSARVHLQHKYEETWLTFPDDVVEVDTEGRFEMSGERRGELRLLVHRAGAAAPQPVLFFRGVPDLRITP